MKKLGFTLAEVLITLMILGVIAAMTVPTLIQDTQKKEQVVQIKKGLSMLNQAVTMNYALEQENFKDCDDEAGVANLLKKRLTVIDSDANNQWVKTQDGLTYYFVVDGDCTTGGDILVESGAGVCVKFVISTKPTATEEASTYALADAKTLDADEDNKMSGYYRFYAGQDRVVGSVNTINIMNAKDLNNIAQEAEANVEQQQPEGGNDDGGNDEGGEG